MPANSKLCFSVNSVVNVFVIKTTNWFANFKCCDNTLGLQVGSARFGLLRYCRHVGKVVLSLNEISQKVLSSISSLLSSYSNRFS